MDPVTPHDRRGLFGAIMIADKQGLCASLRMPHDTPAPRTKWSLSVYVDPTPINDAFVFLVDAFSPPISARRKH